MKVYIVRQYEKLTRWDCNHSTGFKEYEFETKDEAMAFRNSHKRGVFDVYEKEKQAQGLERRGACELKQDMDI